MGNLTRYFNQEEEDFIKEQPDGYLRELVQREMGPVEIKESVKIGDEPTAIYTSKETAEKILTIDKTPLEETDAYKVANEAAKKLIQKKSKDIDEGRDPGWYCSKCDARLPFYNASKCKQCGAGGKKKK